MAMSAFVRAARHVTCFESCMRARKAWAEAQSAARLHALGLVGLENKLYQKQFLAVEAEVATPRSLASHADFERSHVVAALEAAANTEHGIVIKPTHLCASVGVFFVGADGEVRFPSQSGPGAGDASINAWQRRMRAAAADGAAAADLIHGELRRLLATPCAPDEAKPLRLVPHRVVVEERVPVACEVRVALVHGHVVGAATDDCNIVDLAGAFPLCGGAIRDAAARFSRACGDPDFLRVDFFVRSDGGYAFNEACTFLWAGDTFFHEATREAAFELMMHLPASPWTRQAGIRRLP